MLWWAQEAFLPYVDALPGQPLATNETLFHTSQDGIPNKQSIVGIFESSVSKTPSILFSEGSDDQQYGMSIGYDGNLGLTDGEMFINGINGTRLFSFSNGGELEFNGSNDKKWSFQIESSSLVLKSNGVQVGAWNESNGNYSSISDNRLKQDISPLSESLEKILELKPSEYYYKKNNTSGNKSTGFIAQELREVLPQLVTGENETFLSVDYAGMSTFLVKAMQEQNHLITEQALLIKHLQIELALQDARIKKLESEK